MGTRSGTRTGQWREARDYSGEVATAHRDGALAALALRQHGVFSLQQLRAAGFSDDVVHYRRARHRFYRVHRGVYSLVHRQLLSRHGHWMAAVLACDPAAVLSHQTAAALHELRPTARRKIDVTVRGTSHRRRPGIDLHRSTKLTEHDVTVVDGIACTNVARTALDLAAVVSRRSVERAFDQMEISDKFDLGAITDQLERNPSHRGARVVKSILNEHYIGATATASPLEELVFAICRRGGIPEPRVNQWIDFGDGGPTIQADFAWREQRVIVEADGDRFHRSRQARERDTRRDQRAALASWRLIRVTPHQAEHAPGELESTIVRLVRAPPRAPERPPPRAPERPPPRAPPPPPPPPPRGAAG